MPRIFFTILPWCSSAFAVLSMFLQRDARISRQTKPLEVTARMNIWTAMSTLLLSFQLINGGEDVLVFYNDRASFPILLHMMCSERDRGDESGPLAYHITLVELLAACTEGKNVYTEIKCNSLLPLDDIVRVVTHDDCIPEVSLAKAQWLQNYQ